jgi:hypothetical protein
MVALSGIIPLHTFRLSSMNPIMGTASISPTATMDTRCQIRDIIGSSSVIELGTRVMGRGVEGGV